MLFKEAKLRTYDGLTPGEFDILEDIYWSNSFLEQAIFWDFFDKACKQLGIEKEALVKALCSSPVCRTRYEMCWLSYEALYTHLNGIKSAL